MSQNPETDLTMRQRGANHRSPLNIGLSPAVPLLNRCEQASAFCFPRILPGSSRNNCQQICISKNPESAPLPLRNASKSIRASSGAALTFCNLR